MEKLDTKLNFWQINKKIKLEKNSTNKQAILIEILTKESYKLFLFDHLTLKLNHLKVLCPFDAPIKGLTVVWKNSSFVVIYRKAIPFQNACSEKKNTWEKLLICTKHIVVRHRRQISLFIFGEFKWLNLTSIPPEIVRKT